ncbi:MAG TPA: hypothetical protein ENG78_04840 [Acidiferrobacteraceae bacterium]|nr:hypothetical protein [Acidiferrobacteraceae bacterium]HEX20127.1 hypothetical protein [Acidiferrobacteraceae bacterium]
MKTGLYFFSTLALTLALIFALNLFLPVTSDTYGAGREEISQTPHNLSVSGPGTVKATSESRVCVFCHTPHSRPGADYQTPLWNRQLSTAYYSVYTSTALQAGSLGQPDGASKLCLSCHDGTIALGKVNNLWGKGQTIQLGGTGPGGTMPSGSGETTGFTRKLGTNLSNDHPVSFVYDTSLANADGELRLPPTLYVKKRKPGETATLPLDTAGKLQCTTCHNPHLTGVDKFLRWPLTQTLDSASEGPNSILCLQCHNKTGWIGSAHQASLSADEQYKTGNYLGKTGAVWKHACLNCHDTHTVQGAKHLLKEGTDGVGTPKSGGQPAQEETCYMCHTNSTQSVVSVISNRPADIKREFGKTYHMPITASEQGVTGETHSALDANLTESTSNLGSNRHIECSDCHNPHRTGTQRHQHTAPHSNTVTANSPLAGIWGVEPTFTGPTAFPSVGNPTATIQYQQTTSITREYQTCIKCHSSYAYGETLPQLKNFTGGGSYGKNEITKSTDQAKEFNPNNASFHPVIRATGRSLALRNITSGNPFRAPFTQAGTQTMYCSDCHGAETPAGTSTPATGTPWGPHGSNQAFVLKGQWDISASPPNSSWLCFKCHDQTTYASTAGGNADVTGFRGSVRMRGVQNLHRFHRSRLGNNYKCVTCHSAVPHGWNGNPSNPLYGTPNYAKALLVERDDPQPYRTSQTKLLVDSWANSGSWSFSNCRTAMRGGTLRGQTWSRC